jgi:tetratricopeptide (TPR) repeat protein
MARNLVQLDRDRVDGYEYLAQALFMTGEFEASIQASRQVLGRDLERYSAVMNIANSYYYLGAYERSSHIYKEANRQSPAYHYAAGGLANAYAQLDGPEALAKSTLAYASARQLAEAALLTAPDDALTTVSLAYYCAALGDADCAETHRIRALQLAPENVDVHYRSAQVLEHIWWRWQAKSCVGRVLGSEKSYLVHFT